MMELWKTIEGFEDYEVSNCGRVRNKKTQRVLKQKIDKDGYCQVGLHKGGKPYYKLVSRLVALHFIPNPLGLSDVHHIDEFNKLDNSVNNLEWKSHKDNVNAGTRNQRAAETRIKTWAKKIGGMTIREVSEKYGVPMPTLYWRLEHGWTDAEILDKCAII